jgi:threonine/homoserine/homoserine lactone efflux protein
MDSLLPLLGFAVATSVTPGPNVLMVASSAATRGWRATLPHMLGITVGFGAMLVLVGLGLAGPLLASPMLHGALRWVAVAWMLWLAWKIATAPLAGEGKPRPLLGFRGAALFQWVNPKAWMIAAAVIPAFTLPGQAMLPQVLLIAGVFVAVSMPCLFIWAGIGTAAAQLLREPARLRAFNIVMALLLVASLLPMLG